MSLRIGRTRTPRMMHWSTLKMRKKMRLKVVGGRMMHSRPFVFAARGAAGKRKKTFSVDGRKVLVGRTAAQMTIKNIRSNAAPCAMCISSFLSCNSRKWERTCGAVIFLGSRPSGRKWEVQSRKTGIESWLGKDWRGGKELEHVAWVVGCPSSVVLRLETLSAKRRRAAQFQKQLSRKKVARMQEVRNARQWPHSAQVVGSIGSQQDRE